MYTKQEQQIDHGAAHEEWAILDPDGDKICIVYSEEEANALLSHLNR